MPAEVLDHLHEYKQTYCVTRRHLRVAEDRVAEFSHKYGDLQTACDTQDEYVRATQDECDAIKCNAKAFRMCFELANNEEQVVRQSKILEFNKQVKMFEARKKQFQVDKAQRLLREAEWQQRENSERLKGLQHSQQLAQQQLAAGRTAMPPAPPRPDPPPPPRMEPAAASLPQVSTAAQQHV